MKFPLLVLIFLVIFSCKKDEVISPCLIDDIENASFLGQVDICYDSIQQELVFPARSFIHFGDSVMFIAITSLDSTFQWFFSDSMTYECWVFEGNVTHNLTSIPAGLNSGDLSNKNRLVVVLRDQICPDAIFIGNIEE